VPSEQPKCQLQTQHSVETGKLRYSQTQHKKTKTNYRQALVEENNNNNNNNNNSF
jgi:hypothetical protein